MISSIKLGEIPPDSCVINSETIQHDRNLNLPFELKTVQDPAAAYSEPAVLWGHRSETPLM